MKCIWQDKAVCQRHRVDTCVADSWCKEGWKQSCVCFSIIIQKFLLCLYIPRDGHGHVTWRFVIIRRVYNSVEPTCFYALIILFRLKALLFFQACHVRWKGGIKKKGGGRVSLMFFKRDEFQIRNNEKNLYAVLSAMFRILYFETRQEYVDLNLDKNAGLKWRVSISMGIGNKVCL